MTIYDEAWAFAGTVGGSGPRSGSVTLRWSSPAKVRAQAAITSMGGSEGNRGEIGFSAYVQSGQYHTIGNDRFYTSWAPVFFMDDVTQLDIGARSDDGFVWGGATIMFWS